MSEFVLVVVLANLVMLALMYMIRHIISIKVPVLLMAAAISILLCILYPFMVAKLTYPRVMYYYAVLVLAGAALLYMIESTLSEREDYKREYSGTVPGGEGEDAAGVAAGEPAEAGMADSFRAGDHENWPGIPTDADRLHDGGNGAPEDGLGETLKTVENDCGEPAVLETAKGSACKPVEIATGTGGIPECVKTAAFRQEDPDINELVNIAFERLGSGDRAGAAEHFFNALRLNPPQKLAVRLCIEISSIYMAEGRTKQALAVMEMLLDAWGSALDENDLVRIKTIIIQLRREAP